jgi:hypothetical protein
MVGHNPSLKTLLMVETTLMESEEHPTRMELHRSLPTKIEYQTFKTALEYLEAHGVIIFNEKTIVYTGGKNEKLKKLIEKRISI